MINKVIDNYRITEKLGMGGMGVVYKAKDLKLDRDVAVKMLSPVLAHDTTFVKRFVREAKSLARIEDPNIVTVYAFRESDSGSFIVMQYIDGPTLADVIQKNGKMPWDQALPIFKQIINAMSHAHHANVIHRDLKPRNIMLTGAGVVKVTDFGLAKIDRDSDATFTMGKAGTLYYMSPEQVKGLKDTNHLTDIYAMGMILYEMLVGKTPFNKNDSDFTNEMKIVEGKFPPPTKLNPEIPKALADIVLTAISKEPANRFQSARELLEAIQKFEIEQKSSQQAQVDPSLQKRRKRRALIAYIFILMVIVVMVFLKIFQPGKQESESSIPSTIVPGREQEKDKEIENITRPIKVKPQSIEAAINDGYLKTGARLVRIALVRNDDYWRRLLLDLDNKPFQFFWYETGPGNNYRILYLHPGDAEIPANDIRDDLAKLGLKLDQVLVEKVVIAGARKTITLEEVF